MDPVQAVSHYSHTDLLLKQSALQHHCSRQYQIAKHLLCTLRVLRGCFTTFQRALQALFGSFVGAVVFWWSPKSALLQGKRSVLRTLNTSLEPNTFSVAGPARTGRQPATVARSTPRSPTPKSSAAILLRPRTTAGPI